jgi:hypothetical protein
MNLNPAGHIEIFHYWPDGLFTGSVTATGAVCMAKLPTLILCGGAFLECWRILRRRITSVFKNLASGDGK